MVNAFINTPHAPGYWVTEECCAGCGARYNQFSCGVSFVDGVQLIRATNGGFDNGGGYRSRGPVL